MNTHADKTQENKSQAVANEASKIQSGVESTFQFVDNRPEAVTQQKLQEKMADNSPRARQEAQLQAMADNYTAKQQRFVLRGGEGAVVQLIKFEFDGHKLDSADNPAFINFADTMARVNRDRIESLVPFLLANSPRLVALDVVWMVRAVWQALGHKPPVVVLTVPGPFKTVLTGLEAVKAQVSRASMVAKTIHTAGLIDANAALIALAGPNARLFVQFLVGEQPETGFDNESAGAIRQRTQVVLQAWRDLTTQAQQVTFFNQGFATDPCICGRLNGVTEFVARQVGIPAEALSDASFDVALSQQIYTLAGNFFGNNNPDWPAFLDDLNQNYAALTQHAKFGGSYQAAKNAYI